MKNSTTVLDPFGNKVLFPQEFIALQDIPAGSTEVYDHPTKVIERPALMLHVKTPPAEVYYYMRSVGWSETLLIGTRQEAEGQWVVYSSVKNPSREQISELYDIAEVVI